MATPSSIPCPTCGKPVSLDPEQHPEAFPFCDSRCRIRDLGAWADGRHVVAGAPLTFDGYDDA